MKINLALKLVSGYSLMVILLITCGIVGYFATHNLSQVSDFLVNEARDTVQGALKTSNGVREKIKVADDILSGKLTQNVEQVLETANQHTEQAFQTMVNASLIPEQQVNHLNQAQQAFTAALNPLLQSNTQFKSSYQQMIDNADQFKILLTSFNELANRIIVERETNWDSNEATNSQQNEEWFAASGSTEAKLALFAQLYYFQRFMDDTNSTQIKELITNSQTDLDIYIDDLSSMQLAEQPYKEVDKSYAELLKASYIQHKELYSQSSLNFVDLKVKNTSYVALASSLLKETDEIEHLSADIIDQEIQSINEIKSSAFFNITATVIGGIVMVLIAYFLTLKMVISPVRQVAFKLNDISKGEGDLTQQLAITGNDEISELSQGFNEFTQQIRQLISQLVEAVEQLGNTSNELATQSGHAQQQMGTQQSATDQMDHAMDDMTSEVSNVSEAAQQADDNMQTMNLTLEKSQQVIFSTLDSVNQFGGEIESATSVIEQLNHDSQQVGSVLDVIQSIAEQTNLLALNAAIEAARAGEQGRGFAVVADEVRTLASRTHESTTEIKAIIERLQKGTGKAAEVMLKSRENAQQTMSQTGTASESLASITNDIQAMDSIIGKITSATASQNEKTDVMQKNLENIRNIRHEATASNTQMNDITQKLNQLASQLQTLVGRFKI